MNIKEIIENADDIWRSIRWKDGIRCTNCDYYDYYKLSDGRYKCKRCGRIFSDTTGTLLHNSKIAKWQWLVAIYKISNTKGISNVELAKLININIKTAWMLQQKVRFLMNDNDKLSGQLCMDEAYIGGWTNMHFNRKMDFLRSNHFIGDNDNNYNKTELLAAVSKKKQHIVSIVDKGGRTKIIHCPNPINSNIIKQVLDKYTENIELLITDESKLYKHLGVVVEQSNHSKHIFITTGGHTSNPCENRFSWVKRKINTIYTHTSEKYLQLYLNQMAWSATHHNDNHNKRFTSLLSLVANNHTYINDNIIKQYNYLAEYTIDDIYNKELKFAQELVSHNWFISEVETKHHIKVKRKRP